jgi:SAM-dependent methyltransferase
LKQHQNNLIKNTSNQQIRSNEQQAIDIGANYQYWRDQGGSWGTEYEQRKKFHVYYHIQELMLADYFSHSAPAKILEYGCGVGRHLRYLKTIPDIEIYGYDQSQSMVNNILQWASPDWLKQHVAIGVPTGKLPYPDNYFDIVYTVEVLIHVNPIDIEALLAELIRISRWQILHLEPQPDFALCLTEHGGRAPAPGPRGPRC